MKKRKSIRIATWGGLGDAALITPSLRALKLKHPELRIKLACSGKAYRDLFRNNPNVDVLRASRIVYIAYKLLALRGKCVLPSYGGLRPSLTLAKPAAHIIAEMLDVPLESDNVELFLTSKEDEQAQARLSSYSNPIVMHIHSRCSKNHLWALENWEALVHALPQFTFIQIGNSDEPRVNGTIDMLGKLSIREAMGVVKHSRCFVGVDSFWGHVASAFNVPGVVLFGDSSPAVWGHDNIINLYKQVPCSPCIDMLFGQKCPYDNKCMKAIMVEEVSQAISRQMDRNEEAHCSVSC